MKETPMAEPTKKEYQLKPIETQLLAVENQQFQAMMANLLSFIALERLALKVDQQTRYEIAPDLTSFKTWQEPVEVETGDKK